MDGDLFLVLLNVLCACSLLFYQTTDTAMLPQSLAKRPANAIATGSTGNDEVAVPSAVMVCMCIHMYIRKYNTSSSDPRPHITLRICSPMYTYMRACMDV